MKLFQLRRDLQIVGYSSEEARALVLLQIRTLRHERKYNLQAVQRRELLGRVESLRELLESERTAERRSLRSLLNDFSMEITDADDLGPCRVRMGHFESISTLII